MLLRVDYSGNEVLLCMILSRARALEPRGSSLGLVWKSLMLGDSGYPKKTRAMLFIVHKRKKIE